MIPALDETRMKMLGELAELGLVLAAEAETEDFLELDADAQVANLCRLLGLTPPALQDGGPGPGPHPVGRPPAPNGGVDFRSSA